MAKKTKVSKEKVLKDALDVVNLMRLELGLKALKEFPKGYKSQADNCPVALSLPKKYKPDVSVDEIELQDIDPCKATALAYISGSCITSMNFDRTSIKTNKAVGKFVKAFDSGRYPELAKRDEDDFLD